jgi:hypothetical protein
VKCLLNPNSHILELFREKLADAVSKKSQFLRNNKTIFMSLSEGTIGGRRGKENVRE